MSDSFGKCNPMILFIYFAGVLGINMLFFNPIISALALFGALVYGIRLKGAIKFINGIKILLPMFILVALINPMYNHRGVTILFYLKNGNPITLESIYYGLGAGLMFITVIAWFSCYNVIMTSDKFIYIFGRIIPQLSLIISMVLRFVPLFNAQRRKIINSQRAMGIECRTLTQRVKFGIRTMSILVSWGLENAVDTADSMKARGYGLKGRTNFAIYVFDKRDKRVSLVLAVLFLIFIYIASSGGFDTRYYPSFYMADKNIIGYMVYGIIIFFPVIMGMATEKR